VRGIAGIKIFSLRHPGPFDAACGVAQDRLVPESIGKQAMRLNLK
jgi:hypothetical protein